MTNPITPSASSYANGGVIEASYINDLAAALNRIAGFTTTATAAGTTVLTVASNMLQRFTGTTTQTVTLPVVTTLGLGMQYIIQNKSTGIVTVQSSGANTVYAVPAGATAVFTCIAVTGTTAASWEYDWTGASTAPSGGSSKVVQIVTATYNTYATSATSTYVDTGLSATITPTSASNQVLVFLSQNGCYKGTADTWLQLILLRNTTQIGPVFADRAGNGLSTTAINIGSISAEYLDSPAQTAAVTYKTQFQSGQNVSLVGVQHSAAASTIVLMEVTP